MTGEINKNGCLYILRRNNLAIQFCPFQITEDNTQYCGDDCPLFEEDFDSKEHIVWLRCANHALLIEIRKDERE